MPHFVQGVETLVRKVYPTVAEEMVVILSRDNFVDSLQFRELQLYTRQAHPEHVRGHCLGLWGWRYSLESQKRVDMQCTTAAVNGRLHHTIT